MNRPIAMKKDGIQTRKRKQKGSITAGKIVKTNLKTDLLNSTSQTNSKLQKSIFAKKESFVQ